MWDVIIFISIKQIYLFQIIYHRQRTKDWKDNLVPDRNYFILVEYKYKVGTSINLIIEIPIIIFLTFRNFNN